MANSQSREEIAKELIENEIDRISTNSSVVKQNGCAACHVLFSLVDKLQTSESDASDLLSEVLFHDPKLNDYFIEMVEKVHMKERMMGIPFSIKTREAKDKFIDYTSLRQDKPSQSQVKTFVRKISYNLYCNVYNQLLLNY
jgi:hypothetical protein